MDWTLADIRAKARKLTGKKTTAQLSEADLDDYINGFYRNQLPELVFPTELKGFYSFSTVAGTGEYAPDATVRALFAPVWCGTEEITLYHDPQQFFELYPDRENAGNGEPEAVLLFNWQLWLAPIPDDAYTIKASVLTRPSAMTQDSDYPTDRRWGHAIALGAAVDILTDDADAESAAAFVGALEHHIRLIREDNLFSWQGKTSSPRF